MIRKSGSRFSEKIMLKKTITQESDPTLLDQTLAQPNYDPSANCGRISRHDRDNSNQSAGSIGIDRAGRIELRNRISTRRCHEFFQFFHRPADLRGRAVDADLRGGTAVASGAADLRIPGSGAADRGGAGAIS